MTKNLVQYHADIDYEATIEKFQAFHSSRGGFSLEVTGGRGRAGAQIVASFKHLNATMNIYHTGLIQITYETLIDLRKCVQILEQYCVPKTEKFELEALGPDDPIDRSVELTTICHWQNTDIKYAMATVWLYWWWNPETDEYICLTPDKDFKVNVPESPYVFDSRIPVIVHVIDKYDEQGNVTVDSEKLRWKAIQELKRVAKEHPRVKFQEGQAVDVPR